MKKTHLYIPSKWLTDSKVCFSIAAALRRSPNVGLQRRVISVTFSTATIKLSARCGLSSALRCKRATRSGFAIQSRPNATASINPLPISVSSFSTVYAPAPIIGPWKRVRTFRETHQYMVHLPPNLVLTYEDKQCRVYPVVQSDTVHRLSFGPLSVFWKVPIGEMRMPMRSAPHSSIPASTTSSTRRAIFHAAVPYRSVRWFEEGEGTDAANNREQSGALPDQNRLHALAMA